jgi:hypothetical protein
MYTRLAGFTFQDVYLPIFRTSAILALDVKATSPLTPAVFLPLFF